MSTIAIITYKGGAGKTTTAVNLAGALALRGKKTLIVDLDAQANATYHLGYAVAEGGRSIYDAVIENKNLPIITVEKGIDFVPSDWRLSHVDDELHYDRSRAFRVKGLLSSVKDRYDFILIDCPPNFVIGNGSGLLAADYVIIPSQPSALPVDGVMSTMDFIEKIVRKHNPSLRVLGILLTMTKRTNYSRDCSDWLEQEFGDLVFSTRIRECSALAESSARRMHIFRYRKNSNGASDYLALADEVISRGSITKKGNKDEKQ